MSEPEDRKKEKPVELEKVAEETGVFIGKCLKKTWSVTKSFGKGLVNTLDKKEERRDALSPTCPHCGASNPPNSNFCARCGKKL